MILLFLLVGALSASPAQDAPESDGDASRKILGSSVVTSVSVIMDNGNGTQTYFADAVGKPVSKPSTGAQLASPINLLNPDRYEFFTFDDNGELVKRLMTLDEIQGIIANGDGEDGVGHNSTTYTPEKKVDDIVSNVQNVLKEEIKSHGNNTSQTKPILDTPDVSSSWSMILPAIFGNSGQAIVPEKTQTLPTPETVVVENSADKKRPSGVFGADMHGEEIVPIHVSVPEATTAEKDTDDTPVIIVEIISDTKHGGDVAQNDQQSPVINVGPIQDDVEATKNIDRITFPSTPTSTRRKPSTTAPSIVKQTVKENATTVKSPAVAAHNSTEGVIATTAKTETLISAATSSLLKLGQDKPIANFANQVYGPTSKPTIFETIASKPTPITFETITSKPTPITFVPIASKPTPTIFKPIASKPTPTIFKPIASKPTPITFVPIASKPTPTTFESIAPKPAPTTFKEPVTPKPLTTPQPVTSAPTTTTVTPPAVATKTITVITKPVTSTVEETTTSPTTQEIASAHASKGTEISSSAPTIVTEQATKTTSAKPIVSIQNPKPLDISNKPIVFLLKDSTLPQSSTLAYDLYDPVQMTTVSNPVKSSTQKTVSSSFDEAPTLLSYVVLNDEISTKPSSADLVSNQRPNFAPINPEKTDTPDDQGRPIEGEDVQKVGPTTSSPHADVIETSVLLLKQNSSGTVTPVPTIIEEDVAIPSPESSTHGFLSTFFFIDDSNKNNKHRTEHVTSMTTEMSKETEKVVSQPVDNATAQEESADAHKENGAEVSVSEKITTLPTQNNEDDAPVVAEINDNKQATEILDQLLLSSTNIYEINTQLADATSSAQTTGAFDLSEKLETTTVAAGDQTTRQNLMSSVEQLISQAVADVEEPIVNVENDLKVEETLNAMKYKPMKEVQIEAATVASSLLDKASASSVNLSQNEETLQLSEAVGSLLSQMYRPEFTTIEDVPVTTENLVASDDTETDAAYGTTEAETGESEKPGEDVVASDNVTDLGEGEPTSSEKATSQNPEIGTTDVTESQSSLLETIDVKKNVSQNATRPETAEESNLHETASDTSVKDVPEDEAIASEESQNVLESDKSATSAAPTEGSVVLHEGASVVTHEEASLVSHKEPSIASYKKPSLVSHTEPSIVSHKEPSHKEASVVSQKDDVSVVAQEVSSLVSLNETSFVSHEEAGSKQDDEDFKAHGKPEGGIQKEEEEDKLTEASLLISIRDNEDSSIKPNISTKEDLPLMSTSEPLGNRTLSTRLPVKLDASIEVDDASTEAFASFGQKLAAKVEQTTTKQLGTSEENTQASEITETIEERPQESSTKPKLTTIYDVITSTPRYTTSTLSIPPPTPAIAQKDHFSATKNNYKAEVAVDLNEAAINESQTTVDKTQLPPETNKNWTLVPTVLPHSNTTFAPVETKPALDSIQPPVPVKLSPQPLQGFGLEDSTSRLDADVYQFVELCNELSFGFWNAVTTGISTARSVFVSPFAATSLLAMVFLGARGATSGEMNEILKLDDMVTFNPHLVFKNVSESIEVSKSSGVATSVIARELYSDRGRGKLLSFYKERARQFYDGHVEEVNFKEIGDVIRRRTNLLVKKYTWGKIPEYMKDGSVTVRPPLAGVSASIFQTDCSSASTQGRDGELYFVVLPSVRQRRLIPIPAVVWRGGFLTGYDPTLDATAASIGTQDQTVSTIFVIPGQQGVAAPGDGLTRLEKHLVESSFKQGAWSRLLRSLIPRPGLELQIPKFSHRSVINATVALKNMGLKDLFSYDKADLRGLNGVAHELHLSDILQINSFVTCGEGPVGENHHSEIYPATARRKPSRRSRRLEVYRQEHRLYGDVDLGEEPRDYQRAFHDPLHDPDLLSLPLSLRPRQARIPESPRLRFDRPFMYFVRHNPTGLILHMGRFNPRLLP